MTVLYYDCFSGISGDMNLGAMVDLGVDREYLKSELSKLDLKGYTLDFKADNRKGITGTRAIVEISERNEGENKGSIPQDSEGHQHDSEGHQYGSEGHRHDSEGHQHGSESHQHGSEDHQHGSEDHQHDSEGHQHGSEDHQHESEGHRHGSESHQDSSEGHQDGSEGHQDGSEGHQDGSEGHQHTGHRNLNDIRKIIEQSRLNEFVKNKSIEIFHKVAEAEATIHDKSIGEIHFHEVGAIDSIVDIVGAVICIDYLKPDRIISSSVELGGGFVECEHGTLPVPAPATAEILKGIPVKYGAVQSETTTPTGAAILASLVDEFTDKVHFKIHKTGYGIGSRDHDIPNVLRVYMGELEDHAGSVGLEMHTASLIECNIDDMNPEVYGYIMDQLFEHGADDVFITPIIMKKARPASKLSVLCSPANENNLTELLLIHTTSLGVRKHKVEKTLLRREYEKIETRYGPVTLKTATYKGKRLKSKPEYDDCIKLARKNKIPVHVIYQEINKIIANMNTDAG